MTPPLRVEEQRGPGPTWLLVVEKLPDVPLAADGVQRERAPGVRPVQEVHVQDADRGLPPHVYLIPAEHEWGLVRMRRNGKETEQKSHELQRFSYAIQRLFLRSASTQQGVKEEDDRLAAVDVKACLEVPEDLENHHVRRSDFNQPV